MNQCDEPSDPCHPRHWIKYEIITQNEILDFRAFSIHLAFSDYNIKYFYRHKLQCKGVITIISRLISTTGHRPPA